MQSEFLVLIILFSIILGLTKFLLIIMMLRQAFKVMPTLHQRNYVHSYKDYCVEDKLGTKKKFTPLEQVNVTLLNSNQPIGEATALILKRNPLVKELTIHCKSGTIGILKDLSLVPTSTVLHAYNGVGQLKHALHKADIVVINGKDTPDDVLSTRELFLKNLDYTKFMAEACVHHCPEAIIIIDIYPINATLPFIAEILADNGVFCANRLLGSVALHSLRAQTLLGKVLGISPDKVHVDVIGGGTPNTMIPVISSSYPGGPAITCVADVIRDKIKILNNELYCLTRSYPILSHAHSLAWFVNTVAEGLTGKPNVRTNAFIRTSALMGVDFFTMPIGLGLSGIETNHGIPPLSPSELILVDEAMPILQSDIEFGVSYAKQKAQIEQNPTSTAVIDNYTCDFS